MDPGNGGEAAAHVFVDDLEAPELSPDDAHHLTRVLRLRDGERVTLSDGRGAWRPFRFGPRLEPLGAVTASVAPSPAITVAFALVKGDRPELVVQKLTELGVDRIVPFVADRSVVRWDSQRAVRNADRLRRVAREAAMQSRRLRLPEVADLSRFGHLVGQERGRVALAQRGGQPPSLRCPTILIGPEGGWSPAELAHTLPTVALGDQVLRAETAAITAASVLTALRSGLIRTMM
jgi:16S rRNA (uracil1498-N3)-methyltransferase